MADLYTPSSNVNDKMDLSLAFMLDEYQAWFLKFLTYFLYPEDTDNTYDTLVLDGVDAWLDKAKDTFFSNKSLAQIQLVHTEFRNKSERYLKEFFETKANPSYANYLELISLFEEFISLIRRMEAERKFNQSSIAESEYLRSSNFLKSDLQRELDRLSRKGKPFCLAYIRLARTEKDSEQVDFLKNPHILKIVSGIFREALRSYDDAYQVSQSDIVLSLKQIGTYDALSTMERLSQAVENNSSSFTTEDGEEFQISLSYYVLQQSPNETPEEILRILREHLEAHVSNTRKIFSYREISSLQKFIRDHLPPPSET